jgi:hypothetical protein
MSDQSRGRDCGPEDVEDGDPPAAPPVGGVIGITGSTVGGVGVGGDPEPFDELAAGGVGVAGTARGGAGVAGAADSVAMGVDVLGLVAGGAGAPRGGAGVAVASDSVATEVDWLEAVVLDPAAMAGEALETEVLDGLTADELLDDALTPAPPAEEALEIDGRVALRVEPV